MAIAEKRKSWLVGLTAILVCALVVGSSVDERAYAQQKSAMGRITPQDYVEIRNLYDLYTQDIDFGANNLSSTLFTPDGAISSLASGHAPKDIGKTVKDVAMLEFKGVRHFVANILITPTAEGAKGQCYGFVIAETPTKGAGVKGIPVFYSDTLVKTSQGWRFKTREFWTAKEYSSPASSLQ